MKILSHNCQVKNSSKTILGGERLKESCYKGIGEDGNGNTRLKPITDVECHLDYLRVFKSGITSEQFALLVDYMAKNNTVEIEKSWSPGAGAVIFPNKVIGANGMVGGFEVDEAGLYRVMIDLPGGYFEDKSAVDQWRLLRGLYHCYSVRCTRIDLAIDDYSYSIIPLDEMVKACSMGQNFGFRKIAIHASGICGEDMEVSRYFGSRDSGKMVRVYDHDGECHRFEAEFKRGYAQPIFERLASKEREGEGWENSIQKSIASIALGAIDFRDRGSRKDNTRAGCRDSVRLNFYQEFIDNINASHCRIRLIKPVKNIRKTFEWVKRQCAPTLSMIAEGLGRHEFTLWMREMIEDGSQRMSNQKELWSVEIDKNKKLYLTI